VSYVCIVADPPWAPRDKLPGPNRGAAKQYHVMSTAEICDLADVNVDGGPRIYREPIAKDAILFLWRLASMQQDALVVVRAWGFDVKSEIVWQKLTKRGLPWFGMIKLATHTTSFFGEH
jgi:N6-adenosine-specific RNA methylase IME4